MVSASGGVAARDARSWHLGVFGLLGTQRQRGDLPWGGGGPAFSEGVKGSQRWIHFHFQTSFGINIAQFLYWDPQNCALHEAMLENLDLVHRFQGSQHRCRTLRALETFHFWKIWPETSGSVTDQEPRRHIYHLSVDLYVYI